MIQRKSERSNAKDSNVSLSSSPPCLLMQSPKCFSLKAKQAKPTK